MAADQKSPRSSTWRYRHAGIGLIALLTLAAAAATSSPTGNGPGVTCDEGYHVAVGKRLVSALRHQGLAFFAPSNIRRNFPWQPDGPPVHPPLGNLILGTGHHLLDPAPDDPMSLSIPTARLVTALGLAALVLVVGYWTARRDGPLAGTIAALTVPLVPRVFGHGHLAALDLLTALFLVAAMWAVSHSLRSPRRWLMTGVAGAIWGLALLVRLHAVLLIPPVIVLMGFVDRKQAWKPLLLWLAAGATVSFVGWPWLWLDSIGHLIQYLGSATERQAVHVFYGGRIWLDHQVPWHYPWVMTLFVMPIGFLAFGAVGAWSQAKRWRAEPEGLFALGTSAWILVVFSLPGVPVYDGVRLFLVVFPLWAVAVGIGASWLAAALRRWLGIRGLLDTAAAPASAPSRAKSGKSARPRRAAADSGLKLLDLAPGVGAPEIVVGAAIALHGMALVVYQPFHLCHYNLLIGGLGGAARAGFELDYWGVSLREPLLEIAADSKGPILLAPSLAPFQAPAIQLTSPSLLQALEREPLARLVAYGDRPGLDSPAPQYAIVYHRRADLSVAGELLERAEPLIESNFRGVWLTKILRFRSDEVPPRRRSLGANATDAERGARKAPRRKAPGD